MAQISVIVPVYKVEAYLERCVRSILRQTFADFELILVDDGSPDHCGVMCDAYAREDGRIHVIHQENGGLSAARNAGIDWIFAHSDSHWLTFVDSDDWAHPKMLESLLDAAQRRNTDVSLCAFARTDGEDPWTEGNLDSEAWEPARFYWEHFVDATIACAKLYRRSLFETLRFPLGKFHEDEFTTYRLLFTQKTIAVIWTPLYAYYRNANGITGVKWSPKRLDAWDAYEQQIDFFQSLGDEALVKFRFREYIDSAKANLDAAENAPNPRELEPVIRDMKKRIRSLVRRAWKRGYIDFWFDFDLLYRVYPVKTRLYRLWLELRGKLGGKRDA